jgi:hypothetical protein
MNFILQLQEMLILISDFLQIDICFYRVVVTSVSFSLTYKSNVLEGWIIVGTITMADGTVISINDVVMA